MGLMKNRETWVFGLLLILAVCKSIVPISLVTLCLSIALHLDPKWLKIKYNYLHCLFDPPNGHLLPLGSHSSPLDGQLPIFNQPILPESFDFWKNHINKSKPVIFKGLAQNLPAFSLWTINYLETKIGDLSLNTETVIKENRDHKSISYKFSKFIKEIAKKPYYLVDSLPLELYDDVIIPSIFKCKNLQSSLTDLVLWLSNGGTKSVLHCDAYDNLLCVLKGSKKVFLVDRTLDDLVALDHPEGLYSSVDVDRVDICKYPGLGIVPWYNVTLEAGDCLYIPYLWFHQVNSSDGFNLALNFWFHHLLWLDSICQKEHINSNLKKHKFDNEQLLKYERIAIIEGFQLLTLNVFEVIFQDVTKNTKKFFHLIDLNDDGIVTLEELYSCDTNLFNSFFYK